MNKDRILIPVAVITVTLLHAGLIALLWETYKPLIPEMANIEFVDLAAEVETAPPKAKARLPLLKKHPNRKNLSHSLNPNRLNSPNHSLSRS